MPTIKLIIPVLIVLGLLQAAVLALPFVYWRFAGYMGRANKFLFGSFLYISPIYRLHTNSILTQPRLFVAFIVHPLLITTLITFTIAPTLLSLRQNLASRLSTAYTALVPASVSNASVTDLLSNIPLLSDSANDTSMRKSRRDWLLTMLSSYIGWKALGALPSLVVLLVLVSLWKGREADGDRGWLAKGLREVNREGGEKEKGVATRSMRTDVQVVG